MANELTGFISEIWSKKLSRILDDKGTMMQCVNKDYEGEIKNESDTVKIRTYGDITIKNYEGSINYDDLTSPSQDLLIDQRKYFAFNVNDIDKKQSNIEIENGYIKRAAIAIDLTKDTFLLGKHVDVPSANIVSLNNDGSSPISLDKTNIYDTFTDLAKRLKLSNAVTNSEGKPWVIIDPNIEAILLRSEQYTQATQLGDKTIREGTIGRIAGLDVLVSTNFKAIAGTFNVLAGINDAISYASQIIEMEKIRLEKSFNTACRGLYVYGGKTIVPEAIAKLICTV